MSSKHSREPSQTRPTASNWVSMPGSSETTHSAVISPLAIPKTSWCRSRQRGLSARPCQSEYRTGDMTAAQVKGDYDSVRRLHLIDYLAR